MHSWHPAVVSMPINGLTLTATFTEVTDPIGEAEALLGEEAESGGSTSSIAAKLAIAYLCGLIADVHPQPRCCFRKRMYKRFSGVPERFEAFRRRDMGDL